jgi:Nuclease-related domain
VSELIAARWRNYGNDRLYVTAADGRKVGWHDLLTDEDHIEIAEHADAYRAAVHAWKGQAPDSSTTALSTAGLPHGQGPPAVVAEPLLTLADASSACCTVMAQAQRASDPEPTAEAAVWEDLTARRPGALAREQAVALRQAAPARTFLARALGVHTEERAWRIGADGEEKVAVQLAKLARKDPRWHFLHAIPVGDCGSDIDHLVVGPGGVFALNTKHHPGSKIWIGGNTFLVNGTRQPYVRNSRFESTRASRLLTTACSFPVFVAGVVVPVGADDLVIKTPPADVHVVNRMALVKWLRQRPPTLDDVAITAIFGAARRSNTWQPAR